MKTNRCKKLLLFCSFLVVLSACKKQNSEPVTGSNSLLIMRVGYLTNQFEGGTEMSFSRNTSSFTLDTIYQTPGDFGSIAFRYKELDTTLFYGTIIWMGKGAMKIPEKLQPTSAFQTTITDDYVAPKDGIKDIFNPSNNTYDYSKIWSNLQTVTTVKQYLYLYPDAKVYTFLYTPSVGVGDPNDWYWIFFIKN